ncbi:hypothetical protein E2C01_064102 [Portunus trituberculatus]|uniref:Uncharacterized protein n=1 Tax=Portunus trituberculatus TaxID=210409 RepID=A0A5B7HC70_PORTR|nr:hypothetical protein [Portunus trituberculatus]
MHLQLIHLLQPREGGRWKTNGVASRKDCFISGDTLTGSSGKGRWRDENEIKSEHERASRGGKGMRRIKMKREGVTELVFTSPRRLPEEEEVGNAQGSAG